MSLEAKLAVGVGSVLLALAIVATSVGFREVQFSSTSLQQIGTLLLTLGLVAIVIERAVEVYVSKRYDPEKARFRRPLTRAEAKLAKAEKLLADERERLYALSRSPSPEEQQHIEGLINAVKEGQEEVEKADDQTWLSLSKLRSSKLRAASFLSLVFGALASFSGIRVLGQFLPMSEGKIVGVLADTSLTLQLSAFRVTDTLLTALLLAGGADGIHKMVSSFKSFRSNVSS